MIYSILLSLLLFILAGILYKKDFPFFKWKELQKTIQRSFFNPFSLDHLVIILFFISLMLLPLLWGLTFYLRTDMNVVVVLLTFTWIYNWVKYTIFFDRLSN
jgi:hypothetical protein